MYRLRNPSCPDRWFYLNPDAPHELKRLWTHLLEKGFLFPKDPFSKRYGKPTEKNIDELVARGDYIPLNKSHFQSILDEDVGEFKIHWALTDAHLNPDSTAKCSVRMAAQTLSSSSAAAMAFLHPEWKTQAEITLAFNNVSEKKNCLLFLF